VIMASGKLWDNITDLGWANFGMMGSSPNWVMTYCVHFSSIAQCHNIPNVLFSCGLTLQSYGLRNMPKKWFPVFGKTLEEML
jgi:hypothetical protein